MYYRLIGKLSAAVNLVELLRPVAEAPGVAPLTSIAWCTTAALALWTADDTEQCRTIVEQGLRLAEASGVHHFDLSLFAQLAWVGLNTNDLELSGRNLERMRALLEPERWLDGWHYHVLAHSDARYRGEKARAAEHAASTLVCAQATGGPLFVASALIGSARADLDQGQRDVALAHLMQACKIAEATRSTAHEYSARKAIAELGLDDGNLTSLRRCMELGAQHEYVSGVWWQPRTMSRLCATALRHGIELDYVRSIIRKRGIPPPTDGSDLEDWPWPIKVHALGRFAVLLDDVPLRFTGKAQRRPLDLLMALISLGGRNVSALRLAEAVWPDADGDAAHVAFTAALARLRKLLRNDEAIVLSQNKLSLDPAKIWVDVFAFEAGLAGSRDTAATCRALDLYRGTFLGDEGGAWALVPRERLRARFMAGVATLSERLIGERSFDTAAEQVERGLSADPLSEELYRQLMRCHAALGRRAEALSVYQRCERLLLAELGIAPGAKTHALFEALRHDKISPS
jgi:DNA-binding SARP family transcriptional activator